MSDKSQFEKELESIILPQFKVLNDELFPLLKKEFSEFQIFFSNFYKTMLREGLLVEDQYRKSIKFSDIQMPPKEAFQNNRIREGLSTRFSFVDSQLEFLLYYCSFSLDFLTNKRIQILAELVRFLDWENILSGSPDLNTQSVASLISSLHRQQHEMFFTFLPGIQKQLYTTSRKILTLLKTVSDFSREWYKYEIRKNILASLSVNEEQAKRNPDSLVKTIAGNYKKSYPQAPLYRELMQEVVEETYGKTADHLQNALLKKLQTLNISQVKPKIKENPLDILDKTLKTLLQCNSFLEEALQKIDSNWALCQFESTSFWSKILNLFKLKNNHSEERLCELIFEDKETGIEKKKVQDLNQFLKKRHQLIAATNSLVKRFSTVKNSIDAQKEESILNSLNNALTDYSISVKELNAFNEYFKKNVIPTNRNKLRGVKIEMNALVSTIAATRSLKNQYVTKSEIIKTSPRSN